MHDWTYPNPDVDAPDTQPALLDQDWHAIENHRVRDQQAESAHVADLAQYQAPHADADVPLPFATPPGARAGLLSGS